MRASGKSFHEATNLELGSDLSSWSQVRLKPYSFEYLPVQVYNGSSGSSGCVRCGNSNVCIFGIGSRQSQG